MLTTSQLILNLQGTCLGLRDSAKVKRSHKVRIEDKLLNEYEENPELIGGAFATLFPLGLTKDDLGKGGPLHPKLVRTWLMSHDRRFAKHRSFNHTRRFAMRLT